MKISGIHSIKETFPGGSAARRWGVRFLVFLLLAPAAFGQPESVELPRAERLLENGLEVLVAPDSSSPVAALQLWVKAGSIHEDPLLGSGLSHYLEHMAFKGPAGELKGAIPREVERLGGDINAYTSHDRTVYLITVPSAQWRPALELLRGLVFEMDFLPEEVESEREVIIKEINMGRDDPGRRLQHLLWRTAYRVHPYRLPVIGYRELFRRVSREQLLDYYRKWYVPNNMILVGAGDLAGEEFLSAAEEIFGSIPPGPYPEAAIPSEPAQAGPRRAAESMDVAQTRIAFAFHIPSVHSPDIYPLDVLALLAGDGRTSDLYRELREERELVYSIGAYAHTPLYPGLFVVQARAEPEKIPEVREAVREVLFRYREREVTEGELARARARVTAGYLQALATAEGRARILGNNLRTAGSADFHRAYLAGIAAVTPEDLRRVAGRYLAEENLTVVRIDPSAEAGPEVPEPAAARLPVEKTVLENGLTVLIGPDRSLPLVSIRMVFPGGPLVEDDPGSGVSQLVSRLLLKGTEDRSAQEIAREIEDYGGSISSYSARNSLGISLDVLSSRTVSALEVLSDVIGNAAFPPGEVNKERNSLLAEIAAEEDDPRSLAGRLLREELFGGHPYRYSPLGTSEGVAELSREELAAFRDRVLTASNGVLAVFGDLDPAEILPVIRELFGELPAGERLEPAGRYPSPPSGERTGVLAKEEITQSVIFQGFGGAAVSNPDRYALEFLGSIFSGLSAPLFARVRIEGGMAYYVGAYQILGLDPGAFVFYAGTVPGKEEEVLEAFRSEAERAREGEFLPGELERVRNRLLGQFSFGRQTAGQRAFSAALDELYGLGYDNWRHYEKRISGLTAGDLARAAQKYFTGEDYAVAIVEPAAGEDVRRGEKTEDEERRPSPAINY